MPFRRRKRRASIGERLARDFVRRFTRGMARNLVMLVAILLSFGIFGPLTSGHSPDASGWILLLGMFAFTFGVYFVLEFFGVRLGPPLFFSRKKKKEPDPKRTLLLKRAPKGRAGEWSPDDYDVFDGKRIVGRIMLHPQGPEGRPWFWSIISRVPQSTDDRGYSATREQAMADFKARWLAG